MSWLKSLLEPLAVLLVGDVLAPGRRWHPVVIDLLHGEVGHEAVGGGAVPVVLAGLEEDAVAGADLLDRPASALAAADAFRDVDRLAERVSVPGRARARREVDQRRADARGSGRCRNSVDVDVTREPLVGPLAVGSELRVICMGDPPIPLRASPSRYRWAGYPSVSCVPAGSRRRPTRRLPARDR